METPGFFREQPDDSLSIVILTDILFLYLPSLSTLSFAWNIKTETRHRPPLQLNGPQSYRTRPHFFPFPLQARRARERDVKSRPRFPLLVRIEPRRRGACQDPSVRQLREHSPGGTCRKDDSERRFRVLERRTRLDVGLGGRRGGGRAVRGVAERWAGHRADEWCGGGGGRSGKGRRRERSVRALVKGRHSLARRERNAGIVRGGPRRQGERVGRRKGC